MKLPLDRSSYPLNIYMRLFIPYFLPEDIEKVLYLDVDMIVQKDISVLFDNDLNNYVVAAVLDPRIITFDNSWGGVLNYKELGLPGTTKYFNTGLLLMNTVKWRAENVTERIISCIDNNKKFANYPDQYGLNVVLAGEWLELDPLWNHFCTIDHPDPYLIHFVQRKPIYKSYDNVERFKKIFDQYLDQTKWTNFKPIGESSRYFKKIKNVLSKF
jgi:lipopolysaccharide biosynthesis glycosyltransferase